MSTSKAKSNRPAAMKVAAAKLARDVSGALKNSVQVRGELLSTGVKWRAGLGRPRGRRTTKTVRLA